MNRASLIAFVVALTLGGAWAANWAVIVAGSNEFYNYRHQCDACHAFHVVNTHGVPPENTIVMIYDDIANDPSNPYPGKMFNKPTAAGTPGVDVYAGCQKDYTSTDVTAANFLAVLTGNSSAVPAGKRVLKSGPKDNVFVFFTDHGGVGILAFPTGPFLQATDLNAALSAMHTTSMYEKLVFYVEACEAGSMFDGLLAPNINIYVTTASNPDESSWGTYCPPDDSVNGVEIGSCLGDLYSVSWMEDSDKAGSMSESLETQYNTVKTETTLSHVMQYGELDWDTLPIGDFEGGSGAPNRSRARPHRAATTTRGSSVDSRDAKLQYLYWNYVRAKTPEAKAAFGEKLTAEVTHRQSMDNLFTSFARAVAGEDYEDLLNGAGSPANCGDCCVTLQETIRSQCGGWSDYALKYVRAIVNSCELVYNGVTTTETLVDAAVAACAEQDVSQ